MPHCKPRKRCMQRVELVATSTIQHLESQEARGRRMHPNDDDPLVFMFFDDFLKGCANVTLIMKIG